MMAERTRTSWAERQGNEAEFFSFRLIIVRIPLQTPDLFRARRKGFGLNFFPDDNQLQHMTLRELVDRWETSELQLMEAQSRIEQTINLALMYNDREFKDCIAGLVAEKNSILKFIEQVVFHLRRKAKQIPYDSH